MIVAAVRHHPFIAPARYCDLELLGEVFLISIGGRNPTRIATFVQVMCSPHNRYLRLNEVNTLRRVVYEYESVVSDYNPDTIYDATFNKVCDDDGGVRYYLFTGVTH